MSFWCKYSEEFSTLLRAVLSAFPRPLKWVADRIGLSLTTLEKAQRNAGTFPPLYLVPLYRCTGDRRVLDAVLAPHGIAWFETGEPPAGPPTDTPPAPVISRRLLDVESAVFYLRSRCLQLAAGHVPQERGCAVEETRRLGLVTMAAVRALEVAAASAVDCRCRQAGDDRPHAALAQQPAAQMVIRESTATYTAPSIVPLPTVELPVSCERCGETFAPDDTDARVTALGAYCGEACAVADWRDYRETKARLRAEREVR